MFMHFQVDHRIVSGLLITFQAANLLSLTASDYQQHILIIILLLKFSTNNF